MASTPSRNTTNLWLAALGIASAVGIVAAIIGESLSVRTRVDTAKSVGFEFEVFYGIAGVVALVLALPLLYRSSLFYRKAAAPVARPAPGELSGQPLPSGGLPAVAMNAATYLVFGYGMTLLGSFFVGWALTDSKVTELFWPGVGLLVVATGTMYTMIYRGWRAIDDGKARVSPGKAVALMLVPLYNIYWIFQAVEGWAQDYNSLVRRYELGTPLANEGLFRNWCLSLLVPVLGTFVWIALTPKLMLAWVAAVNRLAPFQGGARP